MSISHSVGCCFEYSWTQRGSIFPPYSGQGVDGLVHRVCVDVLGVCPHSGEDVVGHAFTVSISPETLDFFDRCQ